MEAHGGGLKGHFRIIKTLEVLHEYLYWPNMKRYVQRICDRCITCKQAKSKVTPHGLYKPLLVLKEPWVDIFMNFILDLSWLMKGLKFIFVIVYRFSKMTYFISCYKIDDAMNIADLLFREVVWLHSIPMIIVFNRNVKLLSNFWKFVR
jgi:hypothetical protein